MLLPRINPEPPSKLGLALLQNRSSPPESFVIFCNPSSELVGLTPLVLPPCGQLSAAPTSLTISNKPCHWCHSSLKAAAQECKVPVETAWRD